MAALAGRTEPMRNHREPHANILHPLHGGERLRAAGGDTGEIIAEVAGYLIGEDDRRAVAPIECDGSVGTGLGAIRAARAALEKESFFDRARRTEPVRSRRRRDWFTWSLFLCGELARRLGDGDQ